MDSAWPAERLRYVEATVGRRYAGERRGGVRRRSGSRRSRGCGRRGCGPGGGARARSGHRVVEGGRCGRRLERGVRVATASSAAVWPCRRGAARGDHEPRRPSDSRLLAAFAPGSSRCRRACASWRTPAVTCVEICAPGRGPTLTAPSAASSVWYRLSSALRSGVHVVSTWSCDCSQLVARRHHDHDPGDDRGHEHEWDENAQEAQDVHDP